MKKTAIAVVLLCATAGIATPVYAADPCATVTCMYGKVTGGDGGDDCKSPEKAFFDILKWKKGSIRWSKTADARKAFLDECTTAAADTISMIISKFGRVR